MTDNPITQAKAMTPWWMMDILRFDGLEIHPVKNYFSPDRDDTWCQPCNILKTMVLKINELI